MKITNQAVSSLAVYVNAFSGTPLARVLRTYTEEVNIPQDNEEQEVTLQVFPTKLVFMVNPKPKRKK